MQNTPQEARLQVPPVLTVHVFLWDVASAHAPAVDDLQALRARLQEQDMALVVACVGREWLQFDLPVDRVDLVVADEGVLACAGPMCLASFNGRGRKRALGEWAPECLQVLLNQAPSAAPVGHTSADRPVFV